MYLAIDVGGTKTLVASLNEQGVIQECVKFHTPRTYASFREEVANTVVTLSTKKFIAAGVAAPGRINRKKGIGIAMGNLPWKNVPIKADIEKIAHCPVVLENDAKLAGLSEAMLLKKEYNNVLYVTFGTGIGTAIIINQQIHPAFADAEGGHILLEYGGKLQKWEEIASGKAIVRRFGKPASQITDPETWRQIARNISIGLLDIIAITQPEVIVLGGGVGRHFAKFENLLKEELKRYETPLIPIPPLRGAARPDEAVLFGCYDLAKEVYGTAHN